MNLVVYILAWPHEVCHWTAARALGLEAKIGPAFCFYWDAKPWQELIIMLAPLPVFLIIPTWQLKTLWLVGCTYDVRDACKLLWRGLAK